MSPRWLGLYLLTIASLTLFPFRPPACGGESFTLAILPSDILMNALLFVPLGLALHRASARRTAAMALALSFAIEFSQQWLPRNPDLTDLVSNTSGALIGHYVARSWHAHSQGPLMSLSTERFLIRAGALALLVGMIADAALAPDNDFSNWEPLPLVVGNETVGDRGWLGDLYEIAVYDRAVQRGARRTPPSSGGARAWKDGGPVLKLDFAGVSRARLDGPGGEKPLSLSVPAGPSIVDGASSLSFEPGRVELGPEAGAHLLERLRATGELTLDTRFRPVSLHQHGPARILSFAEGKSLNLMLAQHGSRVVARIRTPGTGTEGYEPQIETARGVLSGEAQHVSLVYDGYDARILVDGECVAESALSITTAYPLTGAALGGTLVLCCALVALAAASFVGGRAGRLVLGTTAGALAWSVLSTTGVWDHVRDFDGAALVLGGAALLATVPLLLGRGPLTPRGPS